MFGPTLDDYYREILEKVKLEILQESDSQIIGSKVDELAEFILQKHALSPIIYDPSDISFEHKKEIRRVPAHQRDYGYQSEGDLNFEFEMGIIALPIQSSSNLQKIMKLGGSTRYLDGFDERLAYNNGEISYSFDTKWYGGGMDEDAIANEVNSKSDRLLGTIYGKNQNINRENETLLRNIKSLLDQRKAKILSDGEKLNSLTQKIRIPIKQKVNPQATKISIDTKKFVHVIKPIPKLPEEYTLEESILKDILKYVDNQCATFEKTSSAYKHLGEEHLRDIILAALNGIFEGNATGETFVKKGKSDIHLKIDKGEILIFECKIWGGEKLYLETIDQLIRYVTWRQNYGVVMMFSNNKEFSKILAQIPTAIQKHKQYVGGYEKSGLAHFVSEHTLPEDSGKRIKIHHLIYNLYSE